MGIEKWEMQSNSGIFHVWVGQRVVPVVPLFRIWPEELLTWTHAHCTFFKPCLQDPASLYCQNCRQYTIYINIQSQFWHITNCIPRFYTFIPFARWGSSRFSGHHWNSDCGGINGGWGELHFSPRHWSKVGFLKIRYFLYISYIVI